MFFAHPPTVGKSPPGSQLCPKFPVRNFTWPLRVFVPCSVKSRTHSHASWFHFTWGPANPWLVLSNTVTKHLSRISIDPIQSITQSHSRLLQIFDILFIPHGSVQMQLLSLNSDQSTTPHPHFQWKLIASSPFSLLFPPQLQQQQHPALLYRQLYLYLSLPNKKKSNSSTRSSVRSLGPCPHPSPLYSLPPERGSKCSSTHGVSHLKIFLLNF